MPPGFRFLTLRETEQALILTITDPILNGQAMVEVESTIEASNALSVILNFGAVRKMLGGAVVGPLVKLEKRMDDHDRRLVVCELHPNIAEVFGIMRMDRLFEIHPDLDAAVSATQEPGT